MTAIFHPTDLSPASAVAFRHALRLSLHLGSLLTVMHVHGPFRSETPWSEFPAIRQTLANWHEARDHMPKVMKVEAGGVKVEPVLSAYLERHPADLMVLAAHHREGLASWLKPSVSAQLVRHAHVPALIIPEGQEGFVANDGELDLDSVLFTVVEEPDPQIGIDFTFGLLDRLEARPARPILLHAGDAPVRHEPVLPEVGRGLAVTVQSEGEPSEAIVKAASVQGAGLIVITSAGHDSLHDVLFGSTYDHVVRHAPCPILFVPAPGYGNAPPA